MTKIVGIEDAGKAATFDICNMAMNDGNFIAAGVVVHNSILANGVRSFADLMLFNSMGHPGPMQCCHPDTEVLTDKGYVKITELSPVDHKVAGVKDGMITFTQAYVVAKSGRKKILRIKTKYGRELLVSPDHRIATNKGYIRAGNLKAGDEVVTIDRTIK